MATNVTAAPSAHGCIEYFRSTDDPSTSIRVGGSVDVVDGVNYFKDVNATSCRWLSLTHSIDAS